MKIERELREDKRNRKGGFDNKIFSFVTFDTKVN